jgi:putative membrane protein
MEEVAEKRDVLARRRTSMANERTLLAYIRTSLALLGLGVFLIKYEATDLSLALGLIMTFFAMSVLVFGIIRYRYHVDQIKKISEKDS